MTTGKSDQELFDSARRRIEADAFYMHLAIYSAVSILLALIWRLTGMGFPWFVYPVGIWGILIVLHLMMSSVFYGRRAPSERARRAIENEVVKHKERLRFEEELRLKKGKK